MTLSCACTIMKVRRLHMKMILSAGVLAIFLSAQTAPAQSSTQSLTPAPVPVKPLTDSSHADAYYYFTMGHLEEQEFELNASADVATQSVESYKKALALEPNSAVILERLAEIYAKSQHIRDAVLQAQEALKIDPNHASSEF